mmetsp:Transcript_13080/g.36738  ORF Transcript_13080/g.36738 Transcript_13080/m.36738 type:complete len:353 (-) Transcript_13080:454-1512(-)
MVSDDCLIKCCFDHRSSVLVNWCGALGGGNRGPPLTVKGQYVRPDLPEIDIPMPKFLLEAILLRKGFHFLHVRLCGVVGGHPQLLEELLRLVEVRHLRGEGDVSVAGVAQKLGHLLSELQDPVDHWGVVDVPGAGPAQVSLVGLLPQGPVLGVQHHWEVRWDVQGEHPRALLRRAPLVALGDGGLRGEGEGRGRESVHLSLVGDRLHEGLGPVQHVVAELGGELGELLLDLVELLLVVPLQGHASELRVPQVLQHDPLPGLREGLPLGSLLNGLEAAVQGLALREPQGEGDLLWLHLLHGVPKLLGVAHGLEVGHHAPSLPEPIHDLFQGDDELLPRHWAAARRADVLLQRG